MNRKGGEVNASPVLMKGEIICINDNFCTQSDVVQKSLVGNFEVTEKMLPPLNEVRRWANKTWKQAHGLNIYEMGSGNFLFEFADRVMAEQVISGDWIWNKVMLRLQWWSPMLGAKKEVIRNSSTWVRIVDLPLHLWSQEVFKAIGDQCGGWIETEEETQLRNHLK